ncbi:MAG: ATP-binding cassette domain-containing protein [Evtepia sp.]
MGRSGAGKTTLMNIIGCLDTFDAGSYQLDGVNVAALSDEKLAHLRNEKDRVCHAGFCLAAP